MKDALKNEKTCPVCSKIFFPTLYHVYKDNPYKTGKLVCSYSCMRKAHKERVKVRVVKKIKE